MYEYVSNHVNFRQCIITYHMVVLARGCFVMGCRVIMCCRANTRRVVMCCQEDDDRAVKELQEEARKERQEQGQFIGYQYDTDMPHDNLSFCCLNTQS